AALLGADGTLRVVRLGDGVVVAERALFPAPASRVTSAATITGATGFVAASNDGRVAYVLVDFKTTYAESGATVAASIADPIAVSLWPNQDRTLVRAVAA